MIVLSLVILIVALVYVSVRKRAALDRDATLSRLKSEYVHMYKSQFRELGQLCEIFMSSENCRDYQKSVYERVKAMISDLNGDSVGQEHFENLINSRLNNVMKHFRSDFPGFSEEDCRFVCYIMAGFDATTISVILRMPSQAAVYMKKSRIKKQISSCDSQYHNEYMEFLA